MSKVNYNRYTLFPIQYPSLYKFYEIQRDCFWVPKEIDLQDDIDDWRYKLSNDDRKFLTYTLSFFAQADAIVLQNLSQNFSVNVDIPEANIFYDIQTGIEAIHWEMYSVLIDTFINDPEEKHKAYNAIQNYPCIKKKADWMIKWMDKDKPIIESIVAYACVEGIFFSSAFASIFYYKKKGLMPGLCTSNKFISRDEGIHRDFGCEYFSVLKKEGHKIDDETVYGIVKEAVEIEENFVKESLNVELIGINSTEMIRYVKLVADHLLNSLNYNKIYNVKNPFDWMDMINLTSKQNFFEGRTTEYAKNSNNLSFGIDEDF